MSFAIKETCPRPRWVWGWKCHESRGQSYSKMEGQMGSGAKEGKEERTLFLEDVAPMGHPARKTHLLE